MDDLVKRLLCLDVVSQPGKPLTVQSINPFLVRNDALRKQAAAEITRLRAALADAQAVGFAAGVEAVAKEIEGDDDNIGRTMSMSICCSGHECGCMGASVRDYLVYNIRALTPTDATAAAARVLLGDENALRKLTFAYDREDAAQRGEPNPHTFIDLDAPDMGASWVNERIGCAVSALRALTEKTS